MFQKSRCTKIEYKNFFVKIMNNNIRIIVEFSCSDFFCVLYKSLDLPSYSPPSLQQQHPALLSFWQVVESNGWPF